MAVLNSPLRSPLRSPLYDPLNKGGGGSAPSLPAGAIGLWYADEVITTPRTYLPNKMATGGTPVNLMSGTKRTFTGNTSFIGTSSAVVVSEAAADEDGRTQAASIAPSASSWSLSRVVNNMAAGTYTMAVRIKRNAASDQTFRLVTPAGTSAIKTATSAWQTFIEVFTVGTTANRTLYIFNDGTTLAQLLFADWELYAGDVSASIPKEPQPVGHMLLGPDKFNSPPVASGEVDLTVAGTYGLTQFDSNIDFSAGFTSVAIARKTVSNSGVYFGVLTKREDFNTLGAFLENNGSASFTYNGGLAIRSPAPEVYNWFNKGHHCFAHRYDGTTKSLWIDGGVMNDVATTVAAPTARDFFTGSLRQGFVGGSWKYVSGVLFNRALSDAEIRQAEDVLWARAAANGISRGDLRYVVAEGDSITNGTYPFIERSNLTPNPILMDLASAGSILPVGSPPSIGLRVNKLDSHLASRRNAGSIYIVSLLAVNYTATGGVPDPTYLPTLAAYCDARRAGGWKVILLTLPPRASNDHNSARAIINAEIRKWVVGDGTGPLYPGVHCDAIADVAADPTYGTDAAGFNVTYYPDGLHATTAVQTASFGPLYRAAVNSL